MTVPNIDNHIQEFDNQLNSWRNKVKSFGKINNLIKLAGILIMLSLFSFHQWLWGILLWILFMPDLNEIVGFIKRNI